MIDEELEHKLTNLNERIKEARLESIDHGTIEKPILPEDNTGVLKSARAGSEFLGSVIGGGILGFIIDWLLGIKPWGMLSLMVLGFVSGVLRANHAMKMQNSKK